MDYRIYAPWEHYPKTLTHDQMMDPLSVVEDFFSGDSVKGHGKRLKEWRRYTINNQYYNDERWGPGPLLFVYDMNLKLLEAIYLLYCDYQNYYYRREKPSEEQLQMEEVKWAYFPSNLSRKELLEPYKAVNKVFKHFSPQQYRDCLHEWLHSALYRKADFEGLNANDIVSVYENLVKLYAAAWVINQRDGKNPRFKRNTQEIGVIEQSTSLIDLRAISPEPTPAEKLALEELKTLIVKRFPAVQMIVHLGTHPDPFTFFLLILIDDQEKTPEHEVSNKIEDHCQYLGNVPVIVHKTNSAKEGLNMGRRFWATVIEKGIIVHQAPDLVLPSHEAITKKLVLERAKFNWERWGLQGKAFLKGAEFYIAEKNYRLTAFLLHQAVESTLKAIIQAVIGYRVQIHNLSRLIRLSLLFTDELKNVFKSDTIEGVQIFTMLQNAYSQSRYKSEFDPNAKSIEILLEKAKRFCSVAETVYHRFIEKQ